MSERRYVVPAGGLLAALDAANEFSPIRPPLPDLDGKREAFARVMLEAFIRWQCQNPVFPTEPYRRSEAGATGTRGTSTRSRRD